MELTSSKAWQDLVDKLITMDAEPVEGQSHVFRFTSTGHSPVTLRIKETSLSVLTSGCDDGLHKSVELLDEDGGVLAKGEWIYNYSIYAKNKRHPLDDLIEFVKKGGSDPRVREIRALRRAATS